MAKFELAHTYTARYEGGISDHPNDRGGYTAYGVSTAFITDLYAHPLHKSFLASIGLAGAPSRALMQKIDRDRAAAIFKYYFWDSLHLDELSQPFATVWYDAAVNHGKAQATRFAQRALNLIRASAKLAVDGIAGPKTLAEARSATKLEALQYNDLRRQFFNDLVIKRPSQKVFLKGWLNRVSDLNKVIKAM